MVKITSKNVKRVRVIGDDVNEVMEYDKAVALADESGLDLVQVSKASDGAEGDEEIVCKLIDYQKFVYSQKKKEKEQKKKSARIEVKEIRLSDTIQENDMKVKARKTVEIITNGDQVRVVIPYKGRMVSFINHGLEVMAKFSEVVQNNLNEREMVYVKEPKVEGTQVVMVVAVGKQKH